MIEQKGLDQILSVVENPIRRRIIKRLSQTPGYPLELSKELGMGQQLIAAHLGIMEKNGIIGSSLERSPVGPSRRVYFLIKSACLSVGFGPHLYSEQLNSFDTLPSNIPEESGKLVARIGKIKKSKEQASKMISLSDFISEVDEKLNNVEAEKAILLYIRNLAMKHAAETMEETEKTHDEKRVLHYILDEQNRNVENIAITLNLREAVVRDILQILRKELPER